MTLTDAAFLCAAAALIVLSAVLEAARAGLLNASEARIHRLAREGNRSARKTEVLLPRKTQLIRAAALGTALFNTLAAGLVAVAFVASFGLWGIAYAALCVTALVFLFAMALPRAVAPVRPVRVALLFAPFMAAIVRPLVAPTEGALKLVRWLLPSLGVNPGATGPGAGRSGGGGREPSAIQGWAGPLDGMIDLDDATVEDVMVHRKAVEMIDIDLPPAQIVRIVTSSRHTRVPVYRGHPDNIIGMLHSKNLLRALAKRGATPATLTIGKLLSPAWFVPNTTSLRDQLNAFIARRTQFAVVVDEYGSLQGVLTLADIMAEVLGDITGEQDRIALPGVTEHDDGSLTLDGSVTIRDLNRRFGWDLPESKATTIAGLLIHQARIIPVKGQRFTFYGLRFDVLERHRNQITRLRLTPLGQEAQATL